MEAKARKLIEFWGSRERAIAACEKWQKSPWCDDARESKALAEYIGGMRDAA